MATFFNQATLSYGSTTVNSNITTGEIVEVLSVTKTAVYDRYTASSDITYAVNIINSGATPFAGLTLTDNLGAYTFDTQTLQPLDYVEDSVKYFADGVLQPAPTVTAGPPLVITGITVPANGTATVLYTARTNGFAPLAVDSSVVNTVTLSGGITPVTATETVTAEIAPLLNITKSLSPTTVTENGQLTYTFVIENTGNTATIATDNVVVTDTFDPILSDITVTYNGAIWTSPQNYTYDTATGLFQTVAGAITVPAATYTQNPQTGEWAIEPGIATITVTGTV